MRCAGSAVLALCGAVMAAAPLPVRIGNVTAPAGGTAQIPIYLATPHAISQGSLTADLDPAVFGDIASADVFSVTGDQVGLANIKGRHIDLTFSSLTGGIGRLPNVPVAVLNVPVLGPAGSKAAVSVTSAQWQDVQSVSYSLTITPGTLTVGGALSIQNVAAEGAAVRVTGTGFQSGTTVEIDGVSIEATQYVSPTQLNVTLTAAADLTAKRVVAGNTDGEQAVFFAALRGASVQRPDTGPLATAQPVFPQQLYAAGAAGNFAFSPNSGVAVQNPSTQAVDVTFKSVSVWLNRIDVFGTTVTVPPGAIYIQPVESIGGTGIRASVQVIPSAPIRMAVIDAPQGARTVSPSSVGGARVSVIEDGGYRTYSTYAPLTFEAVGSAAPAPKKLAVTLSDLPTPYTVSVSGADASSWLSVAPLAGTTCNSQDSIGAIGCAETAKMTVTVNPSGLAPGTYNAEIGVMPGGMNPQPTVVPVVLNVSAQPLIFVDVDTIAYATDSRDKAPQPRAVNVTSNAGPTPFTVAATTQSGENWLSVSQTEGITPAAFTVSLNPAAMTAASDKGTITVQGPSNQRTIGAALTIVEPTLPKFPINPIPAGVLVSVPSGTTAAVERVVNIPPTVGAFTVNAKALDGGAWLSASIRNGPGVPALLVRVDPTGLAPGTHRGAVTVDSPNAIAPVDVPVTLVIWTGPPPQLTASATSLLFTAASGALAQSQTINVTSGDTPLEVSVSAKSDQGWLGGAVLGPYPVPNTPATVGADASAFGLALGQYTGTLTITAPPGSANSVTVKATLIVTPPPPPLPQQGALPLVTAIVNGASQAAGPMAPDEIVTVFGQNIGPESQLFINDTPAQVLYASATQINAVVPSELAGAKTAKVEVRLDNAVIPAGSVPVREASPAIFTLDSSGQGPAAVLNEDNSINGADRPAARGSIIQMFATGLGAISPVGVSIGGIDARVAYAGAAPDAVEGLMQVNAAVPQNAPSGAAVPVVISVGSLKSQNGATISVR